ncbi:MAG: flagellar hook-associated protein FlgK [Firmicutes bacterium HGW-Firmicutes-15]|nr:MAG: flagellar hook-associated protein FlgK [Firmicutes bacterium HGW-Firmicutes-15]
MTTTFMGLEIGKRSIAMHQNALNITGHNISNANTPGYSRQVPDIVTTIPWCAPMLVNATGAQQMGTGVEIDSIQRMRDSFIDTQIRQENSTDGYWTAMQESLDKIEVVLNEPSDDGLRAVMDQFWASWQDVATNPESEAVRAVVYQRGMALAEAFSHSYRQLTELRDDVNAEVKIKANDVNTIAVQVAELNRQIMLITAAGKQPNDLCDKRDLLIDELSKLADVKIYDGKQGMLNVQLGDRVLVDGMDNKELETTQDDQGMYMLIWKDTKMKARIDGGELRGLLDARGKTMLDQERDPSEYKETIPTLIDELNTMAKSIIVKTNELHRGGYSLNNKTNDEIPDGKNFFNMPDSDPDKFENWAQFMSVSEEIQNDPKNIAAATHRTWNKDASGQYVKVNFGDGSNALKIAELKHDLNNFQNTTKTEGLNIIFDAADPAYLVPLTFLIDAGEGPKQITIDPPASYSDIQKVVEALQTKLNSIDKTIKVRCEGKELVFYSSIAKSLEVMLPGTEITDLTTTGLQNGEYSISTEVSAVAGTDGSDLQTVQQYVKKSAAASIFDSASVSLNGGTPDDINASILLEITGVNTVSGDVTYRYESHEYNRDSGTYASVASGSFILTYGVANPAQTIGNVQLNINGLATATAKNLSVGDKAVFNVIADNTSGAYQKWDIAYDYNDVGKRSQSFVFAAGAIANVPGTKAMNFFTLNDNPISDTYGDDYNGSIAITTTAPLTAANPTAFLSSYSEPIETFMVEHATIDDYWRKIAADVGVLSQESQRMVKNQDTLLNELENKRQSVSGVSMDEEATNMIRFQQGYNAAARFITTIDEALNTIINGMGVVGR